MEPVVEAKPRAIVPVLCTRDRQLSLHGLEHGQIALAAELQRLELNLPLVGELLAGTELSVRRLRAVTRST